MQKTTLYLSDEQHAALKYLARRTSRRRADLIREAVDDYLSRQPRQMPRSIGIISDPNLRAVDIDDWLKENWHPDRDWQTE
jgi:hypothetical protein